MKIKMNRFLSGIVFALSLSVFSCGNLNEETSLSETAKNVCPTITLSLENVGSRTAMPNVTPQDITYYKLIGTFDSNDLISEVWETETDGNGDVIESAYDKMCAAELPVKTGAWTFRLIGLCEYDSVDYASYSDSISKTIGGGRNNLEFALKLDENSLVLGETGGQGRLNITIDFKVASRVNKITAKLVKASDKSEVLPEEELSTTVSNGYVAAGNYSYVKDDVPAGSYIAYFNFYATSGGNDILLGTYPESVNINKLGASSTVSIDNLERLYNVSYYYVELDQGTTPKFGEISEIMSSFVNSMLLNALPYSYSRYSNCDFIEPERTGYYFWKWIQINESDNGTNTSISALKDKGEVTGISKRTVGDLHFAAVYVRKTYAQNLNQIILHPSFNVAQVGREIGARIDETEFSYNRSILKWLWRYKNESGDYVNLSSSTDFAVTYSYRIPVKTTDGVSLVGKKLEAWVLPDYNFAIDAENNKVTGVTIYSVDTATDDDYKKVETSAVALGDLELGSAQFDYTKTELRGAGLTHQFKFKEGNEGIRDKYNNAWKYNSNDIISYSGSVTAPSVSSGSVNVPLTFSVEGYNPLVVAEVPVFVNVKYAVPPTGDAEIVIPELHANTFEITYGKLKFDSSSTDVQYRVGEGSWQNIGTDEFDSGSVQIRYAQKGTKNSEGYIEASDAYSLSTDGKVGKKVLLSKVEYDSSSFVVGGTIKVKATPNFTETGDINFVAENYGYIDWNYKADGTTIFTDSANKNSTESQFTITDDVRSTWYNKSLSVEAVYHYQADGGSNTVTKTTEEKTIGKGTISKDSITLTYDTVEVAGNELSTSRLGITISGIAGAYTASFEDGSTTAKSTSGETYYATISAPCYNAVTQVPFVVNVKTAAPSAEQLAEILSKEKDIIPRGEIRFADSVPSNLEWNYTTDGTRDWVDVVTNATYKTMSDIEFEANDVIYVRFKAKPGVSASDVRPVTVTEDNIGTRSVQITLTVQEDDKLEITATSESVTVSGNKAGSAVSWYVDNVLVEGETGQTLDLRNLPLSYMPVAGIYTVRAVSLNEFDEQISANATVTVSND